jgi:hypothetical protein
MSIVRSAALVALALLGNALVLHPSTAQAALPCGGGTGWCLTINLTGNGTGTLAEQSWSINGGAEMVDTTIQCHIQGGITFGTCSRLFPLPKAAGTTYHVTFTEIEAADSCTSACSGNVGVGLSGSTTLGVGFALLDPRTLTVSKSGTGSGVVTSSPRGIDCGSKCVADYAVNTPLTLTAAPGPGSVFTGWSSKLGDCPGTGPCDLTMSGGKNEIAHFALTPTPTQTPRPTVPTATRSPSPTPSGTAPHATPAPPAASASPGPGTPTESSAPTPPGLTAASSAEPVTGQAGASTPAAAGPADAGAPGSSPTGDPGVTTQAGGADLTPIVLAIIIAGIAIGLGVAYASRRRREPSGPGDGGG